MKSGLKTVTRWKKKKTSKGGKSLLKYISCVYILYSIIIEYIFLYILYINIYTIFIIYIIYSVHLYIIYSKYKVKAEIWEC